MASEGNTTATVAAAAAPAQHHDHGDTAFRILASISFCHLLNDMLQSVIPAVYPILKSTYRLDFGQIGLITLTSQLTASLLQPVVGLYTDRRPTPWSLAAGMGLTTMGLILLSVAPSYGWVLCSVAMIGMGSAVFHPESSRVARMASGGRHGFAQSLFQVGGNAGSSLGPLLAAFIVLPAGQRSIAWFSAAALLAIFLLSRVGVWYAAHVRSGAHKRSLRGTLPQLPTRTVVRAMAVLVALIFSKFFYMASLVSYYTFYLMDKFHLPVQAAQVHLFLFLGAVAAGTFAGGPIGDRIGRKYVIWCSILGILPFTLVLPYANLFWTDVLTVIIGLVLASAFSAILVYAQELVPGKIGTISGLFFGVAFGMGGIGAALLGQLADRTSIEFVYRVCAFLPAIGLLTAFLPNLEPARRTRPGMTDNGAMRLISAILLSAALLSAADLKLGKPLTVKEPMPLATLMAKPADYVGKTVQVKGKIVEVCEMMGCWMDLVNDEGQKLRIKVNDGEIVFPKDASGKMAVAEGAFNKLELSKEQAIARAKEEAEEKNRKFDLASVKGPMTIYQIQGTGAVILN